MKLKTLLIIAITSIALTSRAQSDTFRARVFNVNDRLALEGFDPVSYFHGRPREGDEGIHFTYKNIRYLFTSISNLNAFKSDPEKYEPAYGGWCAFAMGESGEQVKVDPETFKIIEGRLFLFYNFWGNNTLEDWNENERTLKKAADENWRKIIQ